MIVRALGEDDIPLLRFIHEKFFAKEFEFPDFTTGFLCSFIVSDDSNSIISAAGVRVIPEIVAITDKSKSPRVRREALYQVMNAAAYIAKRDGFDGVHVFIQDEIWKKQLLKSGFQICKGQALILAI